MEYARQKAESSGCLAPAPTLTALVLWMGNFIFLALLLVLTSPSLLSFPPSFPTQNTSDTKRIYSVST